MEKITVIIFNLLFIIPMLIYGFTGISMLYLGQKIEDSFTNYINPLRRAMYNWAWRK